MTRYVISKKLGRWPSREELACHHCDVPGCVNPDHLYVGNDATNSADKVRRGRAVNGNKGKIAVNRKVTDATMQKAIDLYFGPEGNGRAEFLARHGWSIKSLARRYGVGDIVIRHFVYGKTRFPFCLNGKQMTDIWSMYFGRYGQGSVCAKGTNVARWTVKTIAAHLKTSESAVEHACIGDRFHHLKRPSLEHLKPDARTGPLACS